MGAGRRLGGGVDDFWRKIQIFGAKFEIFEKIRYFCQIFRKNAYFSLKFAFREGRANPPTFADRDSGGLHFGTLRGKTPPYPPRPCMRARPPKHKEIEN